MSLNVPAVNHKQLQAVFSVAHKQHQTVYVTGRYGVGKSYAVYQYAKNIGYAVIDLKLSQFDAVTLRGIPDVKKGEDGVSFTDWNIPKMFAEIKKLEGKAIIFLDELDKANDTVASASYELLLQRRYGDFIAPDSVFIVAAGNLESDDFRGGKLSTPQLDRMIRVELVLSPDDWLEWAESHGIDSRIISFIKDNPKLLWREGDPEALYTTSPRGWEAASNLIRGVEDKKLIEILVGGCVGEDIGNLFVRSLTFSPSEVYVAKKYEVVRKADVGEKGQFAEFLASKCGVEWNEVMGWLSKYLESTNDVEFVVSVMREMKTRIGEDNFNDKMRTIKFPGKTSFLKKIEEAAGL